MAEENNCKRRKRPLHPWEIQEAKRVFGEGLNYARVRVHECYSFTDAIDRIGQRLKGIKNPIVTHNAITLGNHCYFPVTMPEHPVQPADQEHYMISWLIHELTHAWQYQKMGWKYLYFALKAQFSLKGKAYDFDGDEGLKRRRREGAKLNQFNLEQQGDICRGYYERICRGQDVSNWQPFIDEIRGKI